MSLFIGKDYIGDGLVGDSTPKNYTLTATTTAFTVTTVNTGLRKSYLLTPTSYPKSYTVNIGTKLNGDDASLKRSDNDRLIIEEVTGDSGFDIDFEFVDIIDIPLILNIEGYYEGDSAHNVKFQIYNVTYDQWDNITTNTQDMPSTTSDTLYSFKLPTDLSNYINSDKLIIKIIHSSSETSGHTLNLDVLSISALTEFAITAVNANLSKGYILSATKTGYVITGIDSILKADRKLTGVKTDFLVTGNNTNLTKGYLLNAVKAEYLINVQNVNLSKTYLLSCAENEMLITGYDAGLRAARLLTADKADFVIDTQDARLLYGRVLSTIKQDITISYQDALLLFGHKLIAELGTISIDGKNVTFPRTYVLAALKGEIIITGQNADLIYESLGYTLDTISTPYNITTYPVNFKVNRWTSAVQVLYDGSIVINGIIRI